jgi:hypothetical protein
MERFAGKEPAAGPPLPLEELTAAPDMTGVLTRLRELYRQAEEAGETYKSTEDALERQRAETARLSRALTKARKALVAGRADAGRIARVQYQGNSDLSAYLRLLLAPDPQQALDQGHLIERAASGRLAAMDRLEAGEKRARELAAASRRALEREVLLAARQKKAKDTATARLRTAEGLLASLSAEELTALAGQERRQTAGRPGETAGHGSAGGATHAVDTGGPCAGVRRRADRQALCVGSGGPPGVRLLRADLEGLGQCRPRDPADQPGAVGRAQEGAAA